MPAVVVEASSRRHQATRVASQPDFAVAAVKDWLLAIRAAFLRLPDSVAFAVEDPASIGPVPGIAVGPLGAAAVAVDRWRPAPFVAGRPAVAIVVAAPQARAAALVGLEAEA